MSSRLVSPRLIVLLEEWNWSLFLCLTVAEGEMLAAGVDSTCLVHDRQVVQNVEMLTSDSCLCR